MQKVRVSPFVTQVVSPRFPNLTTAFVPQLLINLKVIRGTRTRKRVDRVQFCAIHRRGAHRRASLLRCPTWAPVCTSPGSSFAVSVGGARGASPIGGESHAYLTPSRSVRHFHRCAKSAASSRGYRPVLRVPTRAAALFAPASPNAAAPAPASANAAAPAPASANAPALFIPTPASNAAAPAPASANAAAPASANAAACPSPTHNHQLQVQDPIRHTDEDDDRCVPRRASCRSRCWCSERATERPSTPFCSAFCSATGGQSAGQRAARRFW